MKFVINVLATRRDDFPLNRNDSFTVNGGKGKGPWLKLKVPTAPDERDSIVEFEGMAEATSATEAVRMACEILVARVDYLGWMEIHVDPLD